MSEQEKDARVEAVARFLWDDGNHGDWRKTSELARDGFRAQARAILAAADAAQASAEGEALAEALRRALEVIAVGDSKNPQADAADELVALGIWQAESVEKARKSGSPAPAVPEGMRLVQAFDAAIAAELPRVSHVAYDSHEICKHFAGEVRKRLLAAAPEAPAPAGKEGGNG